MTRLFTIALIPLFALTLAAQTTETPQADPQTAVTVRPPQPPPPPPPDAAPEQLEYAGDRLRSQKAFDDAIDYYLAALRKRPASAVLHNKIGIAHLQMSRLKEAQKEFQRSIKMDKAYSEAHNNLGVIHYIHKRHKKAIKEYEKALALNDAVASYHSNLGTARFARKEYERATMHFLRALQLDPEIFDHRGLAGVSARMASPEDRARFAYTMAKLTAGMGLTERSLRYLKKALDEGYPGIQDVYKDQEFAVIRKDPRFEEIMARKEPAVPN